MILLDTPRISTSTAQAFSQDLKHGFQNVLRACSNQPFIMKTASEKQIKILIFFQK